MKHCISSYNNNLKTDVFLSIIFQNERHSLHLTEKGISQVKTIRNGKANPNLITTLNELLATSDKYTITNTDSKDLSHFSRELDTTWNW